MITALVLGFVLSTADCAMPGAHWLEQDFETFDRSEEGWRYLGRRDCFAEAADAIALYRQHHGEALTTDQQGGLVWHEGQMRAFAGDEESAALLFAAAGRGDDYLHQALYVEATIAFLNRDREALLEARENLAAIPEPDYFTATVERFRQNHPDHTPPQWPLNLNIVDRFVACFEESYAVAYSGCDDAED